MLCRYTGNNHDGLGLSFENGWGISKTEFAHRSVNVDECQLSLYCVSMSEIQMVACCCISLPSSFLGCKVVGDGFLLLS